MAAYCEEQIAAKRALDPRSFRWITSGRAKILVGCPRGKWTPRKRRCRAGMTAYKKLVPAAGASCPIGSRRIVKRR